jgi:hypothetical protein
VAIDRPGIRGIDDAESGLTIIATAALRPRPFPTRTEVMLAYERRSKSVPRNVWQLECTWACKCAEGHGVAQNSLGWGLFLWLVGYVLGIALFALAPLVIIGWIIMPIGVAITLWVLVTRIHAESLEYYAVLSVVWTALAVVFD